MLEEDLETYLRANAGLANVVGQKVFPMIVPDDESYPALTYQVISRQNEHSLTGASGLEYPRIQFGCWARDYAVAKRVRNALVDCMDGFRGTMGSTDLVALKEDERDTIEPAAGNRKQRALGVLVDFFILASEPFPSVSA